MRTGTRRTKGTIRTGLGRLTEGGFLTNFAFFGKGARGANRAFTDTGAWGALGALGAFFRLKYRGTDRTFEVTGADGAVGAGRNPHNESWQANKTTKQNQSFL